MFPGSSRTCNVSIGDELKRKVKDYNLCNAPFVLFDTVYPPVQDHTKGGELVVAYGRWSFTRVQLSEDLRRRRLDTSTLEENVYIIHGV